MSAEPILEEDTLRDAGPGEHELDNPALTDDARAYLATRDTPSPEELAMDGAIYGDLAGEDPFVGLTHDQVLELKLPEERQLVRDLVPVGAVGTIAGVPETHKSWLAQQIAVSVAKGEGTILGCDVVHGGPVGYFWQDDSTREEAERVKVYEAANAAAGKPLHWFLNLGVKLPDDIGRLRATVRKLELVAVVLDSFYNFLPGVDLKDDAAERIVAQLKREIADETGCTVLSVDHMPWATDTNRQRLRAYGGVFKNAATRFGIYIDANGDRLQIEARGNNIRGFKKRAAYWDADALELRLTEQTDHDEKVRRDAEKVAEYLEMFAGEHSTTALRKAVNLGADALEEALNVLIDTDRVQDLAPRDETGSLKQGHGHRWIASSHTGSQHTETLSLLDQTGSDSPNARSSRDRPCPSPSIRTGSGETGSGSADDEAEIERLADIAREEEQA